MEIRLRPVALADFDEEYVGWYANDDGHLDYFTGSGRVFDRDTLVKDFELGLEDQEVVLLPYSYPRGTPGGDRQGRAD